MQAVTAGTLLVPRLDFRRDQWDRPKILQPDGTEVGYTRVTTLAKTLEEQSQLTAWKQRMTLLGASLRPDIVLAAANARMMPDIKEQKKVLGRLANDAMAAAQSGAKASIGTSLHGFSEHVDAGLPVSELPPMVQPIMSSYSRLVARAHEAWHIRIVGVEEKLVCEDVRAAGTADRLWFFPHPVQIMTSFGPVEIPGPCVVIVDLKTGSVRYGGLGIGCQLGTYAASDRYDVATGERTPIGRFVLDGQAYEVPVHQDLGLVLHLPSDDQGATANLLPVNIRDGYAAALESFRVREIRKASEGWIGGPMELTEASLPVDVEPNETSMLTREAHNALVARITVATGTDDLEEIWTIDGPAIELNASLLTHFRLRWGELAEPGPETLPADPYADAHSCVHGSTHGPCMLCFPDLGDQQPATPAEVQAEREVAEQPAAVPVHCTCDPRQRTGWTHDPELGAHVCSSCRLPSRENAVRLASGQPATSVATHPVSVPAGNGAVANVPDRVQPEGPPVGTGHVVYPISADLPPAAEVPRCAHGAAPEACPSCTVASAADPAALAALWSSRPDLRSQPGLFGARGRELREEWTVRIGNATEAEIRSWWDRIACDPELVDLAEAKWALTNGGINGQVIAS